jgi:hypothetical protein
MNIPANLHTLAMQSTTHKARAMIAVMQLAYNITPRHSRFDLPRASLSSGSAPTTPPAANASGCSHFEVLLLVAPRAFTESTVKDERSERRKAGVGLNK